MIQEQERRAHLAQKTCFRLWCAVDDGAGLVSAAVAAGLEARPGARDTRIGLAVDAPAALVELGLRGCACCLVTHDFHLVVELTRRLLASERRVQLLLAPKAESPAMHGSPARMDLRSLVIGGPAALPRSRVVEIVSRP